MVWGLEFQLSLNKLAAFVWALAWAFAWALDWFRAFAMVFAIA